jgi:RNA polymerase sigma-70 factor, ECF subfamily
VSADEELRAARELTAIYAEHGAALRRLLRRQGVADANLDDAIQDVFVVLLRRIGDHDSERAGIAAWVRGIARRIASNRRRAERRA